MCHDFFQVEGEGGFVKLLRADDGIFDTEEYKG